jgi:hypothetical protein
LVNIPSFTSVLIKRNCLKYKKKEKRISTHFYFFLTSEGNGYNSKLSTKYMIDAY